MSLRLRFNLVLTVVFLAGLVASGWVSYALLQGHARREVAHTAELMIEAAQAIRSYTVDEVRPHLDDKIHETFLPQTVPAYAATETLRRLPANFRDYLYKEATLNPTNPRNRAADWEADLVQAFQRTPEQTVLTGERQTPEGAALFVASPIRITNEACLTCHSAPDVAPATLVQRYGSDNGFGWEMNDVVGIQVVSVPMSVPIGHANRAFLTFMGSLCAVFVVLYIVLNLMLSRMIVRPIAEMSRAADAVSTGDFDIPEFTESSKDEIGQLARSFNRMRRSLQQAMKMIES
jgi:HAMP domain-containing protein